MGKPTKNPFAAAMNTYGTRHYGSTISSLSAEPYTTGTFYIWIILPRDLIKNITKYMSVELSEEEVQKLLCSCCTGVTPPGGTMNKIEFTGVGGVKWSVPGSVDFGTSISLKFFEFQNTPILDFISTWFSYIRSQMTGLSMMKTGEYKQEMYSGTLLYFTSTPTGRDLQYYCAYDGIFPVKDPRDLFTSEIESIDKLEMDIEFNVNRQIRSPEIREICQKYLELITGLNDEKSIPYRAGEVVGRAGGAIDTMLSGGAAGPVTATLYNALKRLF